MVALAVGNGAQGIVDVAPDGVALVEDDLRVREGMGWSSASREQARAGRTDASHSAWEQRAG